MFLDNCMNPEIILEDYHRFLSLSKDVLSQRCKKFFSLCLKLHIVKEKLLLIIESRFQAYKLHCQKSNVDVRTGLKNAVNLKCHSSTVIINFIESSKLLSWDQSSWQYARVYGKTPNNLVGNDVNNVDLLSFLQVVTNSNLFSLELRFIATEVIAIRNLVAHSPIFQISATKLHRWLHVIDKFEVKLTH